jgi:hypothetical protein
LLFFSDAAYGRIFQPWCYCICSVHANVCSCIVSAEVSVILSVLISVHLDSAAHMCCLVINNGHQSCSSEMYWHTTHFVCSFGTQDVAELTVFITNWNGCCVHSMCWSHVCRCYLTILSVAKIL